MKKYFLTGLVILLPLTVTVAIIAFVVNFLTKPFIGIITQVLTHTQVSQWNLYFLSPEQFIKYLSQLIILIAIFFITILIGFITKWFFINTILRFSDKILHKIPIVNKVYKTSQEIIKTLFVTDKKSFKKVVLAPFPFKGSYSLGLVSREAPKTCQQAKKDEELISVFIPTTPNPTTGFLLMFSKKDLIYLNMKTEDAVKYIVSCGVILPPNGENP